MSSPGTAQQASKIQIISAEAVMQLKEVVQLVMKSNGVNGLELHGVRLFVDELKTITNKMALKWWESGDAFERAKGFAMQGLKESGIEREGPYYRGAENAAALLKKMAGTSELTAVVEGKEKGERLFRTMMKD